MRGAERSTAQRFRRAAITGSLVSLLLDLALGLGPSGSPVARGGILAGFFDAQGRALLHGHLAVPPGAVGFEGFVVDGATYEYFGPVLALLRLPVLLVTHALDGRLTQLSMLLALGVLLAGTAGVHWRVRAFGRGAVPLARGEAAGTALLQLAVGSGSIALYLVARPVVYHETELWGAAFAVASVWAVLGVLAQPSGPRVALAGLLAVLTINTRVSVGLVPIAALAVAVLVLVRVRPVRWPVVAGLVVAATAALVTCAGVNVAKFDRPFGIPIEQQVASQISPGRKAALAANHGTIFGRQFVPTTLLAAVRPDAAGTARAFPWIGLPGSPPHVVGDVRFDTLQRSLSATSSMALLCLLTLAGAADTLRRRRWALLGLLGAAATGFAGALTIGYVTSRYLADALPLLALGGALGLQALAARERLGGALLTVAGLLLLLGVAVNGGAGLLEQRLAASPLTPAQRAHWVATQDRIDAALGRAPHGVSSGTRLPTTAGRRVGDLAVVGRCDGLYALDTFGAWAPVERTARSGRFLLEVRGGATHEEALGTLGTGRGRLTLVARRDPAGLRLALRTLRRDQPLGAPVPAGDRARVELDLAPGLAGQLLAEARVDGRDAAAVGLPRAPAGALRLGDDPGDRRLRPFSGSVRELSEPTPVCDRLRSRGSDEGHELAH